MINETYPDFVIPKKIRKKHFEELTLAVTLSKLAKLKRKQPIVCIEEQEWYWIGIWIGPRRADKGDDFRVLFGIDAWIDKLKKDNPEFDPDKVVIDEKTVKEVKKQCETLGIEIMNW